MKRAIGFWMLMTLAIAAESQSKRQATSPLKKAGAHKITNTGNDTVFSLQSVGEYPAKNPFGRSYPQQFSISDPILLVMDARANGASLNFSNSGVVGMPKHAYGFANGHLSLKTTGATTSGTQTGSGSVATGTSLGTFGSAGPAMGVNGKSPYAGTVMWGNVFNMYLPVTDSLLQKPPRKNR